jgi:hypothetical protein
MFSISEAIESGSLPSNNKNCIRAGGRSHKFRINMWIKVDETLLVWSVFVFRRTNTGRCNYRPTNCNILFMNTHIYRATDYGLDGPGSNPGGDENFRPSRPTLGPTQPPVQWVPGLSRG